MDTYDDIVTLINQSDEDQQPVCPYTLSHTKHWCGYSTCRDS